MDVQHLLGRRLGDYQLRQFLGRGGMGAVFLADHAFLELPYAVKVLAPTLALDESYLRRFFHEAKQAARIKDPHVVAVHTAGKVDGLAYMAMEYVPGYTLKRAVAMSPKKRLEPQLGVEAVRQALLGLHAAHEIGIIHRDVKPDNLLLAPDGVVKVADFGLARTLELDDSGGLTRPGQVLGTPGFMAIEQWENKTIDARTDLYAMGVTFYYLLSGQLPYASNSVSTLLVQVAKGNATPIQSVAPHLDDELASIVHGMMARDPNERPASAAAALETLKRWQAKDDDEAGTGKPLAELAEQMRLLASEHPKQSGVPGTSAAHDVGSMAATMTDQHEHLDEAAKKAVGAAEPMEVSRLVAVPAGDEGFAAITGNSVVDLMQGGNKAAQVAAPPAASNMPSSTSGQNSMFPPVNIAAQSDAAPSSLPASKLHASGSTSASQTRAPRRIFAPPEKEHGDTDAWSARPQRKRTLTKLMRFLTRSLSILLIVGLIAGTIGGGYYVVDRFVINPIGGSSLFGGGSGSTQTLHVLVVKKRDLLDEHVRVALEMGLSPGWQHESFGLEYIVEYYDPDISETALERIEGHLASRRQIVAVISIGYTSMTRDIASITEPHGVPLLASYATSPSLVVEHETISVLGADYVAQAESAAQFLKRHLDGIGAEEGKRRATIIYEPEAYSRIKSDAFREAYADVGRVVAVESVAKSPRELVTQVDRLDTHVIFMPVAWENAEPVLRAAYAMGSWRNKVVIGTDSWDHRALHEDPPRWFESLNCFYTAHFTQVEPRSEISEFLERFAERTQSSRMPDPRVAFGYDAGLVLKAALTRAIDEREDESGPVEPAAVHDALRTTDGVLGLTGPIRIDDSGRAIKQMRILRCTPSGPEFVE